MRPSLKGLPKRAAGKARETAAGTPVPAGHEPPPPGAEARPGARERSAMRRRARKASHLREALVRDLGALVVEMDRLGRRNDELVARKARDIEALDAELRGLAAALGERQTLARVVDTGIAGACAHCGTLLATDDRFCSHCGKPVAEDGAPAAPAAPSPAQLQLETVGVEPSAAGAEPR
jgi:hypothetical protein